MRVAPRAPRARMADRNSPGRLARTTMALAARALEDDLALLFESVERRIQVRQPCAGPDSVRKGPNPMAREQHALEGCEIVEHPSWYRVLDLCMIDEGPERPVARRFARPVDILRSGWDRAATQGECGWRASRGLPSASPITAGSGRRIRPHGPAIRWR